MMSTENRNRLMRAFILVMGILPLLFPIGLPAEIDKYSEEFFGILQSLEPGSTIIIENEFDMGAYSMVGYAGITLFQYCWANDINFVIYGFQPFIVATTDAMLNEPPVKRAMQNVEYGEDWIYVGFVPGTETGMARTAENPWFMEEDRYGNKLSELPLTQGIDSLDDFDLVIFLNKSTFYQTALFQQWISPYGIPSIGAYGSSEFGGTLMFYPDLVQGLLNAIQGEIALEALTGYPYRATGYSDALTTIPLAIIILIVLGNINEYLFKKTEVEK